jgi:hypothetical protein
MTTHTRLGLLLAAALGAFVLAALASATPQLNVSATATTTTLGFSFGANDAAPARVSFFSDPALAPVDLSAAPGTVIGTVAARAAAGALGGAVLPLTGTVKVVAADGTYLSNGAQVPVAAAAQACTGNATHTTYWVLTLSAAGQALEVPLFIDAVNSAISGVTTTLCLPSPSVPPPAGAAFGAKVLQSVLTLKGVFPAKAGDYRWRSIVTSYAPGSATVDPASTVETQGLMHAPGAVTLAAKRISGGKRATVSGKVTEGGKPVANATVVVSGGRTALRVKTNAGGVYRGAVALRSATAPLRATATVPVRDLGASACQATFTNANPPIPCVDAVDSGFTAATPAVKPR